MTSPAASIHDHARWVGDVGAVASAMAPPARGCRSWTGRLRGDPTPTITQDTGLTPQHFTDAASFFFPWAYTLGNPVWGSAIDFMGLRFGMLLGCAIWTGASMSHALMSSSFSQLLACIPARCWGSVKARLSPAACAPRWKPLPAHLRAREIALSFSGGTIGAADHGLLRRATATSGDIQNCSWRPDEPALRRGSGRRAAAQSPLARRSSPRSTTSSSAIAGLSTTSGSRLGGVIKLGLPRLASPGPGADRQVPAHQGLGA